MRIPRCGSMIRHRGLGPADEKDAREFVDETRELAVEAGHGEIFERAVGYSM